jgi:cell division protein ZapA
MAQVSVKVGGRDYTLACDDGEEQHLTDLAQYVDEKTKGLSRNFASIGDTRLLLMAGLLVADELGDAVARIEELEAHIRAGDGGPAPAVGSGGNGAGDQRAARLIERVAARLEAIAERVEAS